MDKYEVSCQGALHGRAAQVVIFAEELLSGRQDGLAANLNLARGRKMVLPIMNQALTSP